MKQRKGLSTHRQSEQKKKFQFRHGGPSQRQTSDTDARVVIESEA